MTQKSEYWTSLHGLIAVSLIVAALYFILVEHAEHTLPYLPFLILALCPLMHVFMHKSHSGHRHEKGSAASLEDAYHRGLEAGRKEKR